MNKFPFGLAALVTTAVLLTGCSSDSDAPSASEADQEPPVSTEQNSPETNEDSPDDGDVLGTVKVNDFTTYSITELRNCEPLNDGTIERELELQGFGEHDGERIQIDVHKQFIAGSGGNAVTWSGPEGVFESERVAGITWGPDSEFILGSFVMVDSATQTERIQVDFDLQVPTETVSCR